MKRFLLLFFLLCFFFYTPVYAREAYTKELISIEDDGVSINTGDFYYKNISYKTKQFKDKFDKIYFESIKNQTDEERPFSVNILLFDEELKNIGFISYCSSRELSGDYALLKIKPGASSKMEIQLKKDYFITGKGPSYLKYFSILDSNIGCSRYASNKYEGLNIEEIKAGKVSSHYQERFSKINEFLKQYDMHTFLIIVIGTIAIYIVLCALQNLLYKKMFIDGNVLFFIPFINLCFMVILSFGPVVGVIYFLLLIISIILLFFSSNIFFFSLLGIAGLCLLFNMFKLISKKYGLLYFDPFSHPDDSPIYNWKEKPVLKPVAQVNDNLDEILDLDNLNNVNYGQGINHENMGFSLNDLTDLNRDGVIDEKDQKIAKNVIDYNHDEVINENDISIAIQKTNQESNDSEDEQEEFMKFFR